ncbi:MAG: class I SAM-dependent methyltransferase [Saprospiraceae bacterium]|nr:class I SAM-dependent methyltransferase [Saprospiraceae bacterium]
MIDFQGEFGRMDIYLFDQLMKGRYQACNRILDVGCGAGRNSHFFLKNGYEVYGVDQDTEAIANIQSLAQSLQSTYPLERFVRASIMDMPFDDAYFDLVICNAVLHFSRDHDHFEGMLQSMWRVLAPGGYFFCRLSSTIGVESYITSLGNGRYELPSGTHWYLVDQEKLIRSTEQLRGEWMEPIKTTNVQNQRAMTTWCLRKSL